MLRGAFAMTAIEALILACLGLALGISLVEASQGIGMAEKQAQRLAKIKAAENLMVQQPGQLPQHRHGHYQRVLP
jgi:hypothetical protein